VGLTAATTEVEEDVDGGPLGVLPVSPTASTPEVEEDVDGGAPDGDPRAPTINVKNINDMPTRRCRSW
jgi:hypothetical protein